VAESLRGFVESCTSAGLDGFYMSTQGGESNRFKSKVTFERHIKPHDLHVMRECARLGRFNILHICDYHRDAFGPYDDLTMFVEYPGDVVNVWDGQFTLGDVRRVLKRPTMGGMDRHGPLSSGTLDQVRAAAHEGVAKKPAILAADCTVPPDTPWENLREAIRVSHGVA
jgi:uroporphyrinogen decarboxylase